jgi:hypothetical protein
MYPCGFCPKRVIFRGRNAQGLPVYRSGWFFAFVILDLCSGWIFADWFNMVSETQAEQPHPITPLNTMTPRLEREFRYDIQRQTHNSGVTALTHQNCY